MTARAAATRAGRLTIYAAGLARGIVLVTFPSPKVPSAIT